MGKFKTKMYEPDCVASSLIAGINSNKERLFTIIIDEHSLQKILKQRLPKNMGPQKVVTKKEILKIYDKCLGINKYLAHLPNFDVLKFFLKELLDIEVTNE